MSPTGKLIDADQAYFDEEDEILGEAFYSLCENREFGGHEDRLPLLNERLRADPEISYIGPVEELFFQETDLFRRLRQVKSVTVSWGAVAQAPWPNGTTVWVFVKPDDRAELRQHLRRLIYIVKEVVEETNRE